MHHKQGKCLSRHLGLVCARFVGPGGRLPRLRQKVGLCLSFHDNKLQHAYVNEYNLVEVSEDFRFSLHSEHGIEYCRHHYLERLFRTEFEVITLDNVYFFSRLIYQHENVVLF